MENRITTSEQLNHGIMRARNHSSPFLPSCGMFVSWCQEYTLQQQAFPSEQEFRKALVSEISKFFNDRDWSQYHPSVYHAYLQRTSSDWKEIGTERFERVTEKLYRSAKDLVLSGYEFPVYTKEQLEAPVAREKSDPVVAKAAIENILKEFGN